MSDILKGKEFEIVNTDCIEHMATMPDHSIDMSVFSPPFPALYAYTSSEADIGNSEDLKNEAKLHLSFFYSQLARIIKPGRVIVVHVAQIPRMKRTGEVGLHEFQESQRHGLARTLLGDAARDGLRPCRRCRPLEPLVAPRSTSAIHSATLSRKYRSWVMATTVPG